jgi:hypothetical protein
MGPILPGFPRGYRTTTSAFKWIALIAAVGAVVLYLVFREAIREADDIYDKTGFIPRTSSQTARPPQ